MSWYVEYVIKHSDEIKSLINPTPDVYIGNGFMVDSTTEQSVYFYENALPYEIDFENDTYNNLIMVEKTVEKLYSDKKISPLEYLIISLYASNTPIEDMIKSTGLLSKLTIMKMFSKVCDRIGYVLGGEFTDEGLIDKLSEDYKLTNEQVQKVRNYLNRYAGVKINNE